MLEGYMMYWHIASKSQPQLSQMGSGFCSAQVSSIIHTFFSLFSTIVAGTSMDAEWAFSNIQSTNGSWIPD